MQEVLIYDIVFVLFVLFFSFHIKWWLRVFIGLYYGVVFFYFSKGYAALLEKRKAYVEVNEYNYDNERDVRLLHQFWDEKTAYVDGFLELILVPILIFTVYAYYKGFKQAEKTHHKVLLTLTIIPLGFLGLYACLILSMLGYQP